MKLKSLFWHNLKCSIFKLKAWRSWQWHFVKSEPDIGLNKRNIPIKAVVVKVKLFLIQELAHHFKSLCNVVGPLLKVPVELENWSVQTRRVDNLRIVTQQDWLRPIQVQLRVIQLNRVVESTTEVIYLLERPLKLFLLNPNTGKTLLCFLP